MSDNLQLTTQSTMAMEKQMAGFKKNLKAFFTGLRGAGAQVIGYRVLIGHELNLAKEALPHGEFEAFVRETYALPDSTQQRWREFAALFLAEAAKLPTSPTVGLWAKKGKTAAKLIFEIAPKVLDGKGEVQFMRDMKMLSAPKPDGGFRPNAEKLEKWLAKHHEALKGKGYDELPTEVQEAFKVWYFEDQQRLTPEKRREIAKQYAEDLLANIEAATIGTELLSVEPQLRKELARAAGQLCSKIDLLNKGKIK